jgi:hypothetical protein
MPINFPDAPSSGDTHTVGDKTWTYDGTAWNVVQNNIADHGNLGGLGDDDHTQYLLADGSRTATELTVTNTLTVDTSTLHVDSTNDRVGIGTTTPDTTLDVSGAILGKSISNSSEAVLELKAPYAQLQMTDTDDSTFLHFSYSSGKLIHRYNSYGENDLFTLDGANSRVGIGTTTPAHPLHVTGSDNRPIRAQSTVSGSYIDIQDSTTTGEGYVGIGAVGDLLHLIAGGTQRLTITSSGNVGIGTASPSTKLEVSGTDGSSRVRIDRSGTIFELAPANGNFLIVDDTGGADAIRVTIDSSGRVGIGKAPSSASLDVNGSLAINGTSQIFGNWSSGSDIDGLLPGSSFGGVMYTNTSSHYVIGIRNNDTADSFSIVSGGNNSGGYTADNTFDLLVANFRADGNGSIAGTWTTSASDERLKTVNSNITDAVSKIETLQGFYFNWNTAAVELGLPDADIQQVGLSAQAVQAVMPEAVRIAPISQGKNVETEYLTVMYERLVPLLVEGIKEQNATIQTLTARIEALESAP